MMIPLDPDRLHSEIEQIISIISEVKERIESGVPGDDAPARDVDTEIYLMRMRSALTLAAQRIIAVVDVLGDD